jgi:hypothetical protein
LGTDVVFGSPHLMVWWAEATGLAVALLNCLLLFESCESIQWSFILSRNHWCH